MADAINYASLPSALTAYVHENNVDIVLDVVNRMDTVDHVTLVEANGKSPLLSLTESDVLQPGTTNNGWNAKQFGVLKNRYLDPKPGKVDLSVIPSAAIGSYMRRQATAGRKNEPSITFEEFLIKDYLPKLIASQLELDTIWAGSYNGSGTTAAAICDGYLAIVTAAITAGDLAGNIIDPISETLPTAANILDYVNAFVDAIPGKYHNTPMKLFISRTNYMRYLRKYQVTNGALPYNTEFPKAMVDGTMVELVPRNGMGSSDRMIITPQTNAFLGMEKADDVSALKFQDDKRALLVMADFAIGVNFADMAQVWVNDLDITGTES
jgi:hypothetical protein